jgi:hypothetical protein
MRLRLTTALLMLTVAAAAPAGDDGWKTEKDQDGIQIQSRAVPGWSIREIRGATHVAAPLTAVVAVVDDVAAIPELNDVVAEARVLQRDSATRYRIYAAMKMPWPVSNRDIVNQREITQSPATRAVTVVDTAVADAEPRKGYVRIVKSRQQWQLTPTADGQVLVELQLLSDPAGIPAAVINSMAVSSPYKTLSKLRELVRQARYAQAQPELLKSTATPAGK